MFLINFNPGINLTHSFEQKMTINATLKEALVTKHKPLLGSSFRTSLLILLLINFVQSQENYGNPGLTNAQSPFKNYFDIDEGRTLVGCIVLCILILLSTLGGIGGNLVIFPVCVIFFRFDPHVALANTSLIVSLSLLTRLGIERLMQGDAKRINYDVVMLASAPTVLGSFLGVLLNQASPNALILILTCILLCYLMIRSFIVYKNRKDLEASQTTSDSQLQERILDMGLGIPEAIELDTFNQHKNTLKSQVKDHKYNIIFDTLIKVKPNEKHDQFQFYSEDKWVYFALILLIILFSFLHKKRHNDSYLGKSKCETKDFIYFTIFLLILGGLVYNTTKTVVQRNKNARPDELNVVFEERAYYKVVSLMVLSGLVGTYLSAGASSLIILGLILMKVNPFVASPTGLLIALLYNFSATIAYYFRGNIILDCALYTGLIVIITSAIVRLTVYDKYLLLNRASLLLLFMGILMGMGIVASALTVGPSILKDIDNGIDIWEVRSVC